MHSPISTLLARRRAEKIQAINQAKEQLTTLAQKLGGRFLLFGSSARGTFQLHSDIDLLADFGDPRSNQKAGSQAEAILAELGLPADVRSIGWCGNEFLHAIEADSIELK